MIVAIHQPNFLPWLGFFHKMVRADVFIFLDNVPFSKNSYQNRTKIKSAQGAQWLTIPVLTKGRSGQLTSEVLINQADRWRKTHLKTLRTNYQPAPYYEEIVSWLRPLYEKRPTHLAAFNQSLLTVLARQMDLSIEFVTASSLVAGGQGSELLLQLVQATDGHVYLSGSSGRDYLDLSLFERAGIDVWFQEFHHPTYPQLFEDFVPRLSAVDLLMNVGPVEAVNCLRRTLPAEAASNE